MSNLKNLFVNSSVSYISKFLIIGLSFFQKILLARLLSSEELGIFFNSQTLLAMLVFFASLGMTDTIVRFVGLYHCIDDHRVMDVLSKGLRITLTASVIISVLITLTATNFADYFFHNSNFFIVFIIALGIPFRLVADIIGSANQGVGQLYLKILLCDLLPSILFSIGLVLLFAFDYYNALRWVIILYIVPFIVSTFLFVKKFNIFAIFRSCNSAITTRDLLRYSLPLLLSGIVAWPLTLVPIIMGSLTSTELVSYYSLAISLTSFIYLSTSAIEAAGLSVWSSYLGSGNKIKILEDYQLSTRWGIIFGSLIFAPLFICPYEIVNLLFGSKFEMVAQILPIMSCILFINLITGPTESLLKAYGETRFIFLSRLAVGLVVLLTIYPFLIFWKLDGAVAVYGLSNFVGMAMYSWCLYQRHNLHPVNKYFCLVIISIISSIILTLFVLQSMSQWTGSLMKIISTVLIYCLLFFFHLFLLKAIAPSDLAFMSRILFYLTSLTLKIGSSK